MKIKNYLEIIEKLPQMPYQKERVEFAYYNDTIPNLDSGNSNFLYDKIEFIQAPYRDYMNKVKYRWEVKNKLNIDYKVDDIFIKTTNDLILASLIDLTHKYKFQHWVTMTSNIKSCYIDFKSKSWGLADTKYDKYYYVDDDEIIEKMFIASLNEYPNGVPIVWED